MAVANADAKQTGRQFSLKRFVFLLSGFVVLAFIGSWLFDLSRGLSWGLLGATAIIVIVAALSRHFEFIDAGVKRVFRAYARFCIWAIAAVAPLALFRALAESVVHRVPTSVQVIAFTACGILLAFALLLIATDAKRKRLFDRLQAIGWFAPVVYSLNVAVIAAVFFAAVTYVLLSRGWIAATTGAEQQPLRLEVLLDFYVWHLLDGVPLLKIPETLSWKKPWTYDTGSVGWILLTFRLVVILPVVAAFLGYWKSSTTPDSPTVNT